MESPEYYFKYVEAIKKAESNPDIIKQVKVLRLEAEKEHNQEMLQQICGNSMESKLYRKLIQAKLIEDES